MAMDNNTNAQMPAPIQDALSSGSNETDTTNTFVDETSVAGRFTVASISFAYFINILLLLLSQVSLYNCVDIKDDHVKGNINLLILIIENFNRSGLSTGHLPTHQRTGRRLPPGSLLAGCHQLSSRATNNPLASKTCQPSPRSSMCPVSSEHFWETTHQAKRRKRRQGKRTQVP